MTTDSIPIDPPGVILMEEFIAPSGITQKAVAEATGIPYVRLNEIVKGKRRINAEYAIRLGTFFRTSPELWLRLQTDFELRSTLASDGDRIHREVHALAH